MKSKLTLMILLAMYNCVYSQSPVINNPASQYLEGAKVIIDILQLFKKSKPETLARQQQNYKGSYCNFCLLNSDSIQKIKVTIISKSFPLSDTSIMVIRPKQKECSLQIKCGIYNCKIESLDEKLISWGDIMINEKEILITR